MQDQNKGYAVAMGNIEQQIQDLKLPNMTTVFDVAAESQAQFVAQISPNIMPEDEAKILHQQAQTVANNLHALKYATHLRNDPILQNLTKLGVTSLTSLETPQAAAQHISGGIPERSPQYADATSIQSLFSPGRYLCELYNVAKELHPISSPLHIDQRRPDLKTLILSDTVMQQEVSTLDILLETLQAETPLSVLATANQGSTDLPFSLPYDDNLTIINAVLESKATSLRDIATQLADNDALLDITPALVQEQLGLNPTSYALITEDDLSTSARLAHAVKLTPTQQKWLISNIQNAIGNDNNAENVLIAISEYVRLQRRYGVSSDQFVALISAINTDQGDEQQSFHQQIFTSADGRTTVAIDTTLDFTNPKENEAIIRNALNVTAVEFTRIAGYCFGKESLAAVKMDVTKYSQLYRMAIIPRMLGLSFSQAEFLWSLNDHPIELNNIANGPLSTLLTAISTLENRVQWLGKQKLDITALQAMLTTKYSEIATPELFNFLSNIYHSSGQQDADLTSWRNTLLRNLAAGFHLKSNVMSGLVSWLEGNDTEFTLEQFWQGITEVFTADSSLDKLERHPRLVIQCQKLSQYVLIAQWANLTEQDISLLLQPKSFNGSEQSLSLNLSLLRLLTELKVWQQQLKVPIPEAMRFFSLFGTPFELKIEELLSEKNKQEKLLSTLHEKNEKESFIEDGKMYNHGDIEPIEKIKREDIEYKLNRLNEDVHAYNKYILKAQYEITELRELILSKQTEKNIQSEISDMESELDFKKLMLNKATLELEKLNENVSLLNKEHDILNKNHNDRKKNRRGS